MPETRIPLGEKISYEFKYNPNLLYPIARKDKRDEIGFPPDLEFFGLDLWTAFELSWLNPNGKPMVRICVLTVDKNTKNIIESKSFKLYLNSFNNTVFANEDDVASLIRSDLSKNLVGAVTVSIHTLKDYQDMFKDNIKAESIDDIDLKIDTYTPESKYLTSNDSSIVSEVLRSDLLKSNCLVTGQPDWGTIIISYTGGRIDKKGLLKYIISYRNQNEFHEQCVERIYLDILNHCKPEKLLVCARYTRRGGLDINPIRSNIPYDHSMDFLRFVRQ